MMLYDNFDIERVKAAADIRDFIPGATGGRATVYVKCPECGAEGKGKGLCVTHKGKKNLAKCFACGFALSDAIAAEQYFSKSTFPEAVKKVASQSGVIIETAADRRARSIESHKRKIAKSFCEAQLEASGLTVSDVAATVTVDNGQRIVQPFRRGGMDRYGNINESDDEMLIYYYDLRGQLMTYSRRGAGNKMLPYVRVRWSNPAAHLDRDGRETKYQTPAGAPTRLYIPQYIRERYQRAEAIDTLIVQEGEKKAEKACKHGIASVGIQGIFNIGNEETGLIQDLQYIIQTCAVKKVILLFDSDWDHLSNKLQVGDYVDYRPNAFAKAAIKFKTYVQTLHGIGVSVDIYFGHINENEKNDKGVDDLLVNTLAGRENLLQKDILATLLTHDGKGQYVDLHKITSKTDNQIKDYWSLNDPIQFFERFHDVLVTLPNFRFAKMAYRVEDGKILQASKTSEREFWKVTRNEKDRKVVDFDAYEAVEFISANGFYRIHTSDLEIDQYKFVRIDEGIVHPSGPTEIRDFIYYYILQSTKDPEVRNFFAARLGNLLGPDKLERIKKIDDTFDRFEPHVQRMYYLNGQIQVTAGGIEYGDHILGQVWEDKIINRRFKRVSIIENIEKDENGHFIIDLAEDSEKCEFWRFLQNTSNFWSQPGYSPTPQDEVEYSAHIVNKLTTIGYLLCDYKYQTENKAVIAMDGQLGEVSQSNGRTGKSLIGKAISYILDQSYIDGRNTKNDDDYLYSNVTLRTRNIFLDDVKQNFDFGRFFGALTGDLAVNPKTKARFIIKNEKSPKFYITTNHAINEQSRSSLDRISYMAFSGWYSDSHMPIDDFGHQFFVDWDDEQWCLFDNLMAECCMYYLKSMAEGWHRKGRGAVPPPMRDITMRTLRQQMGEAFFQWAEIYFDTSSDKLNERIARKVMFDAYHGAFPGGKFCISPTDFRAKVIHYCKFKGYHFNISRPNTEGIAFSDFRLTNPGESFIGDADKSGGIEYFSIFSPEVANQQPF